MKLVAAALAAAALLGSTIGGATTRPAVPRFRHVVLVVFENHAYGDVIGSRAAPSFAALARRYALLTRSYGVTHPSLPNYLALVSGSTSASGATAPTASSPGARSRTRSRRPA